MVRSRAVACLVLAGLLQGANELPSWVPAFRSAESNVEAGRCREALRDAQTLLAADISADIVVDVRRFAYLTMLLCSFDLKQYDKAMAAGRAAILADPQPSKILEPWILGAEEAGRPQDAADALLFAVQRQPASVNELAPETLYDLFGALRRAGKDAVADDLKVKLVAIDYGRDHLAVADDLREEVVRSALKAGDTKRALEVAETIVHPNSLVRLLTLNRYQVLWPALEARVGPGMSVAKASAVKAARAVAEGQVIPELSPDAAEAVARRSR
jgi:tetratricopeptide (TPR) repeat protein